MATVRDKPVQPRFQFSLRTLLIVSLGLGGVGSAYRGDQPLLCVVVLLTTLFAGLMSERLYRLGALISAGSCWLAVAITPAVLAMESLTWGGASGILPGALGAMAASFLGFVAFMLACRFSGQCFHPIVTRKPEKR